MTPTETLDPRDPWSKPRRMELVRYAQDLGIAEIIEQMPKDLMVRRLRALGVPPPSVPPRPIGKDLNYRSGDTTPDSHRFNGQQPKQQTVTIDADEILEREWKAQNHTPILQADGTFLSFNEMRAELKAAGVKLDRKWRKDEITARWEVMKNDNASHGR